MGSKHYPEAFKIDVIKQVSAGTAVPAGSRW